MVSDINLDAGTADARNAQLGSVGLGAATILVRPLDWGLTAASHCGSSTLQSCALST